MHRMSTTKPRITITLEPVTALQLKRMSELTGNSQSAMVAEVLEQAMPVFDRLIKVLEAAELAQQSAKAAQLSVKVQSIGNLHAAQKRIERQMGLVLDDFDDSTAPLLEELELVSRRKQPRVRRTESGSVSAGRGAASEVSSTPLSNRGVRSTQKREKTIAQKEGSSRVTGRKLGAKKPEVR